jgi:hypothetical protein
MAVELTADANPAGSAEPTAKMARSVSGPLGNIEGHNQDGFPRFR